MIHFHQHKLANLLTNHSTKIQPGEFVLIEVVGTPPEMVIALIRSVREAGGTPLVEIKDARIQREIIKNGNDAGIGLIGDYEKYRMKKVQAYIGIRGSENVAEMEDVSEEETLRYKKLWLAPVHLNLRVPDTKWVITRYPTPSMAQLAGKSTEKFTAYYFEVCTLVDYSKMEVAIKPLKSLMEETDEVHIIDTETDLRFSIKDIPVVPCAGECNIPDGECFTAPVRESVEGRIKFNVHSLQDGTTFTNVDLRFEKGKIVEATANETDKLNAILDTDEGARYIGEFSLAFNPKITEPMCDTLFDEKIAGSFHFTPGQAYAETDNGVKSAVHWDMVRIQRPEYGGGEIYFDGVLIRKDGRFIHPELMGLNPENLDTTPRNDT